MRLHNGLACAVILVLGRMRSAQGAGPRDLAAAAGVILLCAAAHLVNDLLDAGADRRNRPGRPLPAGALRPADLRRDAAATWLSGLMIGVIFVPGWTGWWVFWALAGPGYSLLAKGRGRLGPVWTAAVITSCWIAGVLDDGAGPLDAVAAVLLAVFLWYREMIKSAADRRGDVLAGYASPCGTGRGLRAETAALAALLVAGAGWLVVTRPAAAVLASGGLFALCTAAAVWVTWRPRGRAPHLAGTILKVGAFAGAPLLWYL